MFRMSRYADKNFMNFRCHLSELWWKTLTLIFSSHKSHFIQKNTGSFLYVQKTSGIFVNKKNIQNNSGIFLYVQKNTGTFLYVQNNTCMNLPYKIIPVCVQGRPKWLYSPVPNRRPRRRRATLIVLFTFCQTATLNRDLKYM